MSTVSTIRRTVWNQQWDRCWVCGRWATNGRWLETHEIARGVFRAKAMKSPAAWLRVCCECHPKNVGSIVHQLALKKIHDPEWYDRVAVNRLRDRQDDAITEADVDAEVKRILDGEASLDAFRVIG